LVFAPFVAAGCTPTQVTGVQQPADPLVGVMAPPGMPRPTTLPPTAPADSPASSPYSNSSQAPASSNPATLASLSGWTGPGGRPLAINDNPNAGQLSSSKSGDGYLPPNPHPRVERVPDVNPNPPTVTPTASWQTQSRGTPAAPNSSDTVWVKQLQDRGVIDQKQDPAPEGLRLTCYVQRQAGGVRILEVVAADYPAAAQAIIRQLDGK
jgi:hypothetical protein